MKFSEPSARKLLHSRRIQCDGYEREDGLWDIEAHLLDTRSYELPKAFGATLKPHDALHQMGLRITIDGAMTIRQVEALTEHGPAPECPAASAAYHQLMGLQIGKGFSNTVRKMFSGSKGCTHLTELLIPMATTAFQTVWQPRDIESFRTKGRKLIDTCHAYRSSGEIVRHYWPEHDTGPARQGEDMA